MVRILLDAGDDIETRDSRWGETPLLKAASTGRTAVILLLLERGADSHATNFVGRDALRHFKLHQKGNEEAVGAIEAWLERHEKKVSGEKKESVAKKGDLKKISEEQSVTKA